MSIAPKLLQSAAALIIRPYRLEDEKKSLPRPAVYIVRHNDLRGPLNAFVSLKPPPHLWVLAVLFHFTDCYYQYRDYTFSVRRDKEPRRFSLKALAAAGVAPLLIRWSGSIPVHRGKREIFHTLKETNAILKSGESIVIAADVAYNNTSDPVKSIYTGFFHLEKAYFQDTGEHLPFIPAVFNRKNRRMILREPLFFRGEKPFPVEKRELTQSVIEFLNQS